MGIEHKRGKSNNPLSPEDARSHAAAYRIASTKPVEQWKQAIADEQDPQAVRGILVNMHNAMREWAGIERKCVAIVLGPAL